MDDRRFDELARGLATPASRRALLSVAASAILAGLFGGRAPNASTAACRKPGQICRTNGNCCSRLCGPADRTGHRRCICPSGLESCSGACVTAVTFQSDPTNCGSCRHRCPNSECQIATCVNGNCGFEPNPAMLGRACTNNDRCTVNSTCQANGSCSGTQVICTALDQCHTVGDCDPGTGFCSNPKASDGTTCDDGSPCTSNTTCQNGVCIGDLFNCPPSSDRCTLNTCVAINGKPVCQNTEIPGCIR